MLALVQAALFASLVHQGADVSVTVHANVHVATISDKLIGAGIEDVNHELIGGLYTQMIWGESFEESGSAVQPGQ
eukprot:gene20393-33361_t